MILVLIIHPIIGGDDGDGIDAGGGNDDDDHDGDDGDDDDDGAGAGDDVVDNHNSGDARDRGKYICV